MQSSTNYSAILALSLALVGNLSAAEVFPLRSAWRYFVGTNEASTPNTAWRTNGFPDATWQSGSAPVGYPSAGATGLEATIQTTLPTSAAGGYTCVFLRKTFVVNNPADFTALTLRVQYDDGYAAWVNGTEIGRAGVLDPLTYTTLASDHEVTVSEDSKTLSSGLSSLLVVGTNVVAVQVFNTGSNSSDLFIDAALTADVDEAPTILATDPTPDSIVQSLTYVTVTFTEGVSGVDASDLLINNIPAASVVTNNPREYQFAFTQPPTGAVSVAWAVNPGISDLDGAPNAFVPGAAWTYTLNPNAIPSAAIISEFLADNSNGISDEDGTRADWIEIYNPGLVDVNLGGWFLTDTTNWLTQWQFPTVILGPNKYLLVWASEKNRTNPAAPLHTNFKLSKNAGSRLMLLDPQTNVASSFASYPVQSANISYGRDRVDPNLVGYFTTPTPGAQNSVSGSGFAPAPVLSLASGVYTNASVSLVITVPSGTTVRYTTDGSLPTTSSAAYSTPLTLQNNTTIKVRAFPSAAGLLPSDVVVRNFVFLDASTRDFNSNLPILILSTEGRAMASSVAPGQPRTKGTFVVVDAFRGRSALAGKIEYIGPAEFEVFGQTSAGFAKKPYNIELQDAFGNDQSESILGLPKEADWKLRNPYSDKCLMNDFLAYEIFDKMGNYSCRRRFVEVFVDTGVGRLSYPADYVGVEVFLEKIERGENRVDIAELTAAHTNQPSITGGFMFKKDKDSTGDLNFTGGGQGLKLHEPKPNAMRTAQGVTTSWPGAGYTPSASNQLSYLVSYLDAFAAAMNAPDWLTRTGTNHYSNYIDVDAFVDQHWIVEFAKQIDGYRISNFYNKDRGKKVAPVPIWDWNLAFGNANYNDGGHTSSWYYTLLSDDAHIWLRRLVGNQPIPGGTAGDPDFIQRIIDRWGVLRTNVMNGDRLVSRIDELATLLSESAARNYAKYPILNDTTIWPNPQGPPAWDVDYSQPTYDLIISEMKKWTAGRYAWIDAQFPKRPQLNLPPGDIAAGSSLSISTPAGITYYTLDGRDPRLSQSGGAVSPSALTYSTPVTLNGNARVFARARVGSVWSPPAIATYVVQSPRLVISEIMYHPAAPILFPGVTNIDNDFEYIEVMNVGSSLLNLTGYTISGGVDFTFPNVSLAATQRMVVVKNRYAFTNRYGASFNAIVAGEFMGNLANEGNRLILQGPLKEPILDFSYDDDWYPITDGFGFSLVIVDENAAVNTWGEASSWRPSGVLHGTPGHGDAAASNFPPIIINEVLSHSDPPPPTDTIELHNLSGVPVDIGGWLLTDDFRTPRKYRIADGTSIAADGFLTFDEGQFNSPFNTPTPFALGSVGDEVYLFSADSAGYLTGYYHGFQFGAARNGVTFGRYLNSQGDEHFVAQASPTLGATNSGPLVGPVVVSEIQYHPVDVFANGSYWNNTEDEYIELRNISGNSVPLYDPAFPSNTWQLRDAVSFTFPTNVSIPAGEFIVVASINSANTSELAAFRMRNGIAANVPVFGPWSGELDNSGAKVELVRPDTPEPGNIPYVLVERVHYTDLAPWDLIADGFGASLQRLVPGDYGNDPTNWIAASPTPGAVRGAGPPVAITQQPASTNVFIGGTATFSSVVSGSGVTFQWRFNGSLIPGATGPTLTLTNLQLSHSGQYSFMAFNGGGSVISSNATLSVLTPLYFSIQPTNQNVLPGTNVTIQSLALGNGPVRYQWRFEGTNLLNETNASYVFTNASLSQHGTYSVTAVDDFHNAVSSNAFIFVLVKPIITRHITSQTVLQGGNATFSLIATGAPPLWYRWIRNSGSLPGATTSVPVLVITNVQASGTLRVAVTNVAQPTGAFSPGPAAGNNVQLIMLPDVDGDGIWDAWETNYFGNVNTTNNAANALEDPDGDGMSNRDEYLAGTNPTNALSVLKIVLTATNANQLQFVAQSNISYSLQWRTNLSGGSWSNLTSIIAQPLVRTVEVNSASAPSAPERYLRVVTPQSP